MKLFVIFVLYKKASDEFRDWNKANLKCYISDYKNLTYFREYSQDSCLLECKMKKIAKLCQCLPWYMVAARPNQTIEGTTTNTPNFVIIAFEFNKVPCQAKV